MNDILAKMAVSSQPPNNTVTMITIQIPILQSSYTFTAIAFNTSAASTVNTVTPMVTPFLRFLFQPQINLSASAQ